MTDVRSFAVGPIQENAYIVRANAESKEAVIVDPGEEPQKLLQAADALGVKIEAILITHCHFDHIGAVAPVAKATGAPVYCPEIEVPVLTDVMRWVPPGFGPFESWQPEHTLKGGENLQIAGLHIEVIFTPGHSPGHLTYAITPTGEAAGAATATPGRAATGTPGRAATATSGRAATGTPGRAATGTPGRAATGTPGRAATGTPGRAATGTPGPRPAARQAPSPQQPQPPVLLSGDVLFQGSVGRVDLPGGDWPTLERSIATLMQRFPSECTVFPGHMGVTTLRAELQSNPFLTELRAEAAALLSSSSSSLRQSG